MTLSGSFARTGGELAVGATGGTEVAGVAFVAEGAGPGPASAAAPGLGALAHATNAKSGRAPSFVRHERERERIERSHYYIGAQASALCSARRIRVSPPRNTLNSR